MRTRDGSSPPAAQWRIADSPDYFETGGVFKGDSVYFFRVLDGELMRNGDAVISISPDAEVIVLDSTGRVREVLGGKGDGPQEFRSMPFLYRNGDKLVLYESGRLRELGNLGLAPPRPFYVDRWHSLAGVLEDGVVVTAPGGLPLRRKESDYTVGLSVTPFLLWRGETPDTLLGPPSPPRAGFPFYKPDGNLSAFVPGKSGCLPDNHYGISGTRILIADASTGRLLALDPAGAVDTIFQSDRRATVTKEMVDGARAYLRRVDAQGSQKAFLDRVGSVGDPLLAAWSDALWTQQTVWLRHATPCFIDASAKPQLWDIVDLQTGVLVAVVEVPAPLYLLAVAADRILAVATDDLGVQHLGVYRVLHDGAP
jgi:hypothetical protein